MRERWTDQLLFDRTLAAMRTMGATTMPSCNRLRAAGFGPLASTLGRRGIDHEAVRMGIPLSDHASRMGWRWEDWVADQAILAGNAVERRTTVKAPYDLRINGVAVDVKVATGAFVSRGWQWTWRIAKPRHVADMYGLVAIREDASPILYMVPKELVPITCATLRTRRFDQYINAWPA